MVILKSNNLPTYLAMIPKCLVMVGADTCPSCRKVKKELGSIGESIEILYIDGDRWDNIADELKVEYYPTFIYYEDTIEIKRVQSNKLNVIKKLWN
jgi:thiol-disulfide isomerase/thioredoxin|tara:strand:+ start:250 stop:537 length:288 start_codon:yes stop_codon:yes gene_type:complete